MRIHRWSLRATTCEAGGAVVRAGPLAVGLELALGRSTRRPSARRITTRTTAWRTVVQHKRSPAASPDASRRRMHAL